MFNYWIFVDFIYVLNISLFAYIAYYSYKERGKVGGKAKACFTFLTIFALILFLQELYFLFNTLLDPAKYPLLPIIMFPFISQFWIFAKLILTIGGFLILTMISFRPKHLDDLVQTIAARGEIKIAGSKFLYTQPAILLNVQKDFERMIGKIARRIYYDSARKTTQESMEKILKTTYVGTLSKTEKFKFIESLFSHMGLGFPVFKLENNGHIIVKNSAIAEEVGKSKEVVCFYTAGVLCGLLNAALGKKFEVKETKCKAQNHPFCEFIVKETKKK